MKKQTSACSARGCKEPGAYANGQCVKHYMREFNRTPDRRAYMKKRDRSPEYKAQRLAQRRTQKGCVMSMYWGAKARVEGRTVKSARKYYFGKPIMSQEDFVTFVLESADFQRVYKQWVLNGFVRRDRPSPDRRDPNGGYTVDNIEIIPLWQQQVRATATRCANYQKIVRDLIRLPSKGTSPTKLTKCSRPGEQQAIYDAAGVVRSIKNGKKAA